MYYCLCECDMFLKAPHFPQFEPLFTCSLPLKDGQSNILYMFWDSIAQMLSVELQKSTEGQ